MEKIEVAKDSSAGEERTNDLKELLQTLPTYKAKSSSSILFYLYEGFWYPDQIIEAVISTQQHFQACNSDLILATVPKAGTTWLKALAFSIVNRTRYAPTQSPLLTTNPQDLVPFLEFHMYMKNSSLKLEDKPHPRILATHMPYVSLPSSIKHNHCRIVYLFRNPLDVFISYWKFMPKFQPFWESLGIRRCERTFDEMFDSFCQGVSDFGPFWDHTLGYWKASLERPDKVLFLKYEDLKEDIVSNSKRLANFLGFPFSEEEERQGLIEEITKLCSFDNLRDLEVNRMGIHPTGVQYDALFREGKVGDWVNYLTPSMADGMRKLMEEKLSGSGLTFQT